MESRLVTRSVWPRAAWTHAHAAYRRGEREPPPSSYHAVVVEADDVAISQKLGGGREGCALWRVAVDTFTPRAIAPLIIAAAAAAGGAGAASASLGRSRRVARANPGGALRLIVGTPARPRGRRRGSGGSGALCGRSVARGAVHHDRRHKSQRQRQRRDAAATLRHHRSFVRTHPVYRSITPDLLVAAGAQQHAARPPFSTRLFSLLFGKKR